MSSELTLSSILHSSCSYLFSSLIFSQTYLYHHPDFFFPSLRPPTSAILSEPILSSILNFNFNSPGKPCPSVQISIRELPWATNHHTLYYGCPLLWLPAYLCKTPSKLWNLEGTHRIEFLAPSMYLFVLILIVNLMELRNKKSGAHFRMCLWDHLHRWLGCEGSNIMNG